MGLLAEGKVTGLRIDHPDGLWDPASYLWRLQERYRESVVSGQLSVLAAGG
jgi:(1->4)-alpha-D-glucan 1-alpha-D-glucosylmutase